MKCPVIYIIEYSELCALLMKTTNLGHWAEISHSDL